MSKAVYNLMFYSCTTARWSNIFFFSFFLALAAEIYETILQTGKYIGADSHYSKPEVNLQATTVGTGSQDGLWKRIWEVFWGLKEFIFNTQNQSIFMA